MNTYLVFRLLISVTMFSFFTQYIYADQSKQADDPVQQCAEGRNLFDKGANASALLLLEAGFNGRDKANFANPEDLGYCAYELASLHLLNGEFYKALDPLQVALSVFRASHNQNYEGSTLITIGLVYQSLHQYKQALNYFQQALTFSREIGSQAGQGQVFFNLGSLYKEQGQYTQALDYYQQALEIAREVGKRDFIVAILYELGKIYEEQDQYSQALDFYKQGLDVAREAGHQRNIASMLNSVGGLYEEQGQYAQALVYYQQALDIAREADDREGESYLLNNLGAVYRNQGQYTKALNYHLQALAIMRELNDRLDESPTLSYLGAIYEDQGQYAQALDYYQQSLAILRETGNQEAEHTMLGNLGRVYLSQGQYSQALDSFQQALEIAREVGDRESEGKKLNGLGFAYAIQGNYALALDYYQQSLAIAREVSNLKEECASLNGIGGVYEDQGQYAQAMDYYQQALAIAREEGDHESEGTLLNNIGMVYVTQSQYVQALDYLQQSLALKREGDDQLSYGTTLGNLGAIYYYQGQYAQAMNYFQQSISILEELRTFAGNDTARINFIARYSFIYHLTVYAAHQLRQDEQAFIFTEQGRARSFLDALTTGVVELSDQSATDLIAHEQETYAGLLSAKDALAKAKAQTPLDETLIIDLEIQLANAKLAYTEAIKAIEARGDELTALVPGRSTVWSLAEVQAALDDQTTLVSYFIIDDKKGTLAFVITHNSFDVVQLPVATPANLKTAIEGLTAWPSLQDARPKPLQDLYTWLIAPLKDKLTTPHVGIIPHLALHYVPFAALTDGQTYLSEQYQLFELPSASSLRYIQQHAAQATNSGAVVFGNPASAENGLPALSHAAAEAEAVAQTLKVDSYTGAAATELQLRQVVTGTAILHLAAHGAYNQYNPLYSTLYLAPDSGGRYDGLLEVHEVFGLNLKGSQLVVLSACETQLGQLSTGDEVVGMTRAFMFAGTPSVLASLWHVDDEATQTLMTAFYKHWLEDGMNKAQALQAAQADVRADPRWKSPYYWAAFVLSGDVGAVSNQPVSTPTGPTYVPGTNITHVSWNGVFLLVCSCCGLSLVSLMLFVGWQVLRHRVRQ